MFPIGVCLCFVVNYFVSFLVLHQLEEQERAGCFAFIVLRMFCYFKYSVTLPHGAVGWSAVCVVFPDYTHLLLMLPLFLQVNIIRKSHNHRLLTDH